MKKRDFVFLGVIGAAALGAGVYFGQRYWRPAPALPAASATMFALSLPDSHGKTQALAQWRGKPLVVNFWAPWCAPCVEEMPDLQQLRTEFLPRGVEVIGLGIDKADAITQFQQRIKTTYPLLVAGTAGIELAQQFGNEVGGLPFTLVLDANGAVRYQHAGRISVAELRAAILSVL